MPSFLSLVRERIEVRVIMIANKNPTQPDADVQLRNFTKVYVAGMLHPDIRVPFFVIPSEVEGSLDISVRL